MFRNLMLGVVGAALCTTALANMSHAAEPAFTLSQLELKAGKLVVTGKTAKAKARVTLAPFARTVTSSARKAFTIAFKPTAAQIASCQATISVGSYKETLVISNCGAKGNTGPMGKMGPVGAMGPTGANGVNGTNGIDGAQGQKGDTGPAGPKGDKGDTATFNIYNFIGSIGARSKDPNWFYVGPTHMVTLDGNRLLINGTVTLQSDGLAAPVNLAACYTNNTTVTPLMRTVFESSSFSVGVLPSEYGARSNTIAFRSIPLDAGSYKIGLCMQHKFNDVKISGPNVGGYMVVLD